MPAIFGTLGISCISGTSGTPGGQVPVCFFFRKKGGSGIHGDLGVLGISGISGIRGIFGILR